MSILDVRGLTVQDGAGTPLVHDVSFAVGRGERVGLIGESGSGKSMTALAVLGLLPDGLRATGSVLLRGRAEDDGIEMVRGREPQRVAARGRDIAVVFQEPLTALDPLMRLGHQIAEPLVRRARASGKRLRGAELRAAVHEISGGQRQRVAIAMALACDPALLIADEPTTALDVTVQAEVLALLDHLVTTRGMSLLFISHDLAVVAGVCDRVVVLKDGVAIEQGTVAEIVGSPRHPYTRELVSSARALDDALTEVGR
jgi:peptide/nickel transport system ATP-binding protein